MYGTVNLYDERETAQYISQRNIHQYVQQREGQLIVHFLQNYDMEYVDDDSYNM